MTNADGMDEQDLSAGGDGDGGGGGDSKISGHSENYSLFHHLEKSLQIFIISAVFVESLYLAQWKMSVTHDL